MRTLPLHVYPPAELHCVLPSCDQTREIGLGLRLADGTLLRVRLSAHAANVIEAALSEDHARRTGTQSLMSSGRPSVDGSVVPGQSQ